MPAVSKKQQKYFGYLLSTPEERKKKGISKKAAKDFAQDIQEVSPPGWGHTKAEKEKTKPWKPKSKIGGTAAAFKRALDDGRFKGLPGSTTKKEKTADMFKLMWSMKKKGDKPHYKPGTDKKYKKYQDEGVTYGYKGKKYKKLPDHVKTPSGWGNDDRSELGKAKDAITDALGKTNTKKHGVLAKEALSTKDAKKLNKASVLDQSKDPKDWESARARRTEIDYKDLVRQMKKKKMRNEATTMKDNNLFGNAYAGSKDCKKKNKKAMAHRYKTLHKGDSGGDVNESDDYEKLKKKIGSKKKHDKPAIGEGISYKDFMSNVQKGIN